MDPTSKLLAYWLLRAHESGHRVGWEPGPSTEDTMNGISSVLANLGLDPCLGDPAPGDVFMKAYERDYGKWLYQPAPPKDQTEKRG